MERILRSTLKKGRFTDVDAVRSRIMSSIRSKSNRSTELALRLALVRAEISGWKLHQPLPGRPDFFFPRRQLALFVDGCFWHGCRNCGHIPKTRSKFWSTKINRNKQRDRTATAALRSAGISVIRIWEHELKQPDSAAKVLNKIIRQLNP